MRLHVVGLVAETIRSHPSAVQTRQLLAVYEVVDSPTSSTHTIYIVAIGETRGVGVKPSSTTVL